MESKQGIENFIIKKLNKAHTLEEVRVMLVGGGFSKEEIEKAFHNVKLRHKTLHQDAAASNNFFPLLKKSNGEVSGNGGIRKSKKYVINKLDGRNSNFSSEIDSIKHLGLFAGRIRRKDFIVSILFLFSLFFASAIIVSSLIDAIYPESWNLIGDMFSSSSSGAVFLFIPILFAPFTLIFLSIVTRRLHDLDLPGIISFFYLGVFIYPFSQYASRGIIVFDIILFILFILLLSKRGDSEPNKYGKLPASHGSTFTKILNIK